MNSRRFAGIFIAIFMLGALPLLLVQPTGSGSAGLSAGFMAPLTMLHLILLLVIGLWGTLLGKEAITMLPVTFVAMTGIAGLLSLEANAIPYQRFFIFGAILLFALSIAVSYSRAFIISASVASSLAFHLGNDFMGKVPDIASPVYYLFGLLICSSLILATGMSLGLTLGEEVARAKDKLKTLPQLAGFFSLF